MKHWPLFVAAALLLFGCLEVQTEEGLDKWTPAGEAALTYEPPEEPTPSPTAAATPGASPNASPSIEATPSPSPSPSPSPEPVSCTVLASGQDVGSLKKRVIVRFTQEVSDPKMRCHSTRSWQNLELEEMSSGEYQGFVDCTYTSTGSYRAMAQGGGVDCEAEFDLEE